MRVIMHIGKSPAIVMGQPACHEVRLSSMFSASSHLHFTTTIILPPMFPAALK